MLSIWLAKFRNAWHEADDRDLSGSRSEYAMRASLPMALLAYSEWLDSEGLIVGDAESDDLRTHEQLVMQFIERSDDVESA